MRRNLLSLALSFTLGGCASCNILSSNNSPMCDAELLGLLVVTAPVMLPYTAITNAQEEHRAVEDERKLRTDVEHGDLNASESCIFECPWAFHDLKDDRWRVLQIAARQVVASYAALPELSPKQQAIHFAAHKALADAQWKDAPKARVEHLAEVIRIAQSDAMWRYVSLDSAHGNTLPVNGGYFSDVAENTVIDLITLRHEAKTIAAGTSDLPMECDLTGLEPLLPHAKLDSKSLCKLAADFWPERKRRRESAQQ